MGELINRRAKLLGALTYFSTRTAYFGTSKLYWLLYLLDFRVYSATRSPVTDLEYYAGADGPVPLALDDELAAPGQDFVRSFDLGNLVLANGSRLLSLTSRQPFDPTPFSALEQTHLDFISAALASTPAGDIDERYFLPTEPWRTTYENASRELELVDYRLVHDTGRAAGRQVFRNDALSRIPLSTR